jgi:hypothetical protein
MAIVSRNTVLRAASGRDLHRRAWWAKKRGELQSPTRDARHARPGGTGTGSRPSPSDPSTVCSTPSIRCRRGLHAALAQGAGSGAEGLGIRCLSRRRFAPASVPCRHALAAEVFASFGLACEPALLVLRDSS